MLGFVNICHPDYADPVAAALGKQALENLRDGGVAVFEIPEPVTDHKSALRAARAMVENDVDGVILFYGAFVLCSTAMTVVTEARLPLLHWGVPMMVRDGLLSTTGSYVAFSMFNGTLNRLNIPHENLIAEPDSEAALQKVRDFAAAAETVKRLRRARVGLVGYTSMSIYPGTFDHVMMRYLIGPEIEHFDSYTLINRAEAVKDIEGALALYSAAARFPEGAPEVMVERAAKLYVALKELCREHDLGAITVKCQYEFSK
ncbi:MAG: hypothetical protein GX592_14595, partial [Clostridiales bacterium]|nr:hypothetical protein [Clostridiales bacterium]